MLKLIISYVTLLVILFSIGYDFYTGEINMKGSAFYLDSDLPVFIGFGIFKLSIALGFVAYYKKQLRE
ncbi:hypothetical protein DXX92_12655 [Thalassotalea euphylliae]|uniref:Uncharacterized protein n=1 Tax=Thalassotalea euphylliae TaxID=1655234 RepID=A0A3E0UGC7_9GAMM|nr:hypothetical protein DXX92_12655 [Thalassotalea euphylliae]